MKPEEKLPEWSAGWVADGLVSAAQREAILTRHPVPAAGTNRFLAILATIGGALLVVGVSLIIKSNWQQLGDWVKIGGLLVLLCGAYGLGWRLKLSPGRHPRLGDACLMAGAVLFLLGIALVSQIYHIDSRPANGVLLWWAGIALLPWLTRAKGMQFVSLVAGLTWLAIELVASDSWLLLRTADGRWSYEGFLFAAAGVLVGLALTGFGLSLRRGRFGLFAGMHEGFGLIMTCTALYALGFTWSARLWHRSFSEAARPFPVILLTGLLVIAAGWAWRRNADDLKRLCWPVLSALVPVFAHLLGLELLDSGWLWGGLSCLSLFLLNIGMVRAGLATGREGWINLGMAFIALNIITRYFLLFGSMLEGGVFFIVTGLLVLGLGWYLERRRRQLVGTVRREGGA